MSRRRYHSAPLVFIEKEELELLRKGMEKYGYTYLDLANRMPDDVLGQKPTCNMINNMFLGKTKRGSKPVLEELRRLLIHNLPQENTSVRDRYNKQVEDQYVDRILTALDKCSMPDKKIIMFFVERLAQ